MESTILDGLDPETEKKVIDEIAEKVCRRGLQVPAVLALESHKPLGPVLSQVAMALSPFLMPFFGYESVTKYGSLFAKRDSIERLIQKIEAGAVATSGAE